MSDRRPNAGFSDQHGLFSYQVSSIKRQEPRKSHRLVIIIYQLHLPIFIYFILPFSPRIIEGLTQLRSEPDLLQYLVSFDVIMSGENADSKSDFRFFSGHYLIKHQ